jgi:hypothetical protein
LYPIKLSFITKKPTREREKGMASLLDEPIPRAPLRAMTEDERKQYVNGFIDLIAMPYRRDYNNRDLETAVNSLVDAIAYACSKQMT